MFGLSDPSVDMYSIAFERTAAEWGPAWRLLGPVFQRALIAEAVLLVAAKQDDSGFSDRTVRQLINYTVLRLKEKAT